MTPTDTTDGTTNSVSGQSIFARDFGELFPRRSALPNATDIIFCQASTRMILPNTRRGTAFCEHVSHIVSLCSDEEVGRIETMGIVAVMKDVELALQIEPKPEHCGNAMDSSRVPVNDDSAIAIIAFSPTASPVPAAGQWIYGTTREKPIFNARHRSVPPTLTRTVKRRPLACTRRHNQERVTTGSTEGGNTRMGDGTCRLAGHRNYLSVCRAPSRRKRRRGFSLPPIIQQNRMWTRKMVPS